MYSAWTRQGRHRRPALAARGPIEWEDYSNFAMVTRFAAGAMGLRWGGPHVVVTTRGVVDPKRAFLA